MSSSMEMRIGCSQTGSSSGQRNKQKEENIKEDEKEILASVSKILETLIA